MPGQRNGLLSLDRHEVAERAAHAGLVGSTLLGKIIVEVKEEQDSTKEI